MMFFVYCFSLWISRGPLLCAQCACAYKKLAQPILPKVVDVTGSKIRRGERRERAATASMDKVNCSDIYDKSVYVRLVSGVTCGASVVGSVLIILSYLCFKRLRTRVRQILLHISVADAGVATANLVGAAVYFDRYYHVQCEKDPDDGTIIYQLVSPRLYISSLCKAQAFVALYCTYNSILWTVSLAVYLYFILVHHGTLNAKRFLMFAYFFCYGMPLLLSLWALLTGRLGYSPYNSAGWCTVILVDPIHPQERDLFMGVIGYDMWIYLAMVLVSVLYLAMKTFLGEEVSHM